MEIRIALKEVGSLGFSNKLKMLSKGILLRYQLVTIHACVLTPQIFAWFVPDKGYERCTSLTQTFLRAAPPVAHPLPQATRHRALNSGAL